MKEKFVFSLFSNLFINAFNLIAGFILLMNLSVGFLGIWIFLNTICNLGFLFIELGIDTLHYQYSAKKDFSEYFGTFFSIKIVIILLNIVITLILITILQLWNIYLLLLFLYKIISELSKIFLVHLKSKNLIFKAYIPLLISNFFTCILTINLALNTSHFSDPILYLCVINFIITVILVIFLIFISTQYFKNCKPRKDLALIYLKDVRPFILQSTTMIIATYLGNLIIFYSYGNEELGYFSFVNGYIIPIFLIISTSLISIYLTLFSEYFGKEDMKSVKRLTYVIEKYSSIILLSVIIITFLNAELIFTLFFPKYRRSVIILYIMIFIPYITGISQPYSFQMVAGKNIRTSIKINIFAYISILILMILLIPKNILNFQALELGIVGYALAKTIPLFLWAIINRYYTNKYYGINFQKKVFLHIPIAFFSFVIAFYFKNWLTLLFLENLLFILIFSSLIALAIFSVLLFMIKELKREDLNIFIEILKLKNYVKSLKEEFKR